MHDTPGSNPDRISALRAIAHPIRMQMLSLLTNNSLSASALARELDISAANASYHLRQLATSGLVVEDGEEHIRGGVAKLYTHPWNGGAAGAPPTAEDRADHLRVMADELIRRAALRDPSARMHTTDAELWVAPDVRDRVQELLDEAATLLHGHALPPRSPGARRVSLTSVIFDMDAER